MSKIAFFDDRADQRETFLRSMRAALPEGWECVDNPPLPEADDFPQWIITNDVQVLLIDWVLNEQAPDVETPVSYKGDSVVRAVRSRLPSYPVFVVSAHTEDDEDLEDE